MTLVSQQNNYINCRSTNGTTMLKSVDHDSMSGEQVGTTSGLMITSGKSDIWPLAAPENQGLRKAAKIPKGGKRPGKKWINSICEEAGRCQVCWERIPELSYYYEHCGLSVRQEEPVETESPCCYEHC
jgi:hypothetical protein